MQYSFALILLRNHIYLICPVHRDLRRRGRTWAGGSQPGVFHAEEEVWHRPVSPAGGGVPTHHG